MEEDEDEEEVFDVESRGNGVTVSQGVAEGTVTFLNSRRTAVKRWIITRLEFPSLAISR